MTTGAGNRVVAGQALVEKEPFAQAGLVVCLRQGSRMQRNQGVASPGRSGGEGIFGKSGRRLEKGREEKENRTCHQQASEKNMDVATLSHNAHIAIMLTLLA